jgi:hypothetical protein
MTNYNWIIGPFECILNQDGLEKVITTVHWRLRGVFEDVTAEVYGAQRLEQPNTEAFIPYTDLSQEQVEGWLEAVLNVDELKEKIDLQISAVKNPISATLTAPWNI